MRRVDNSPREFFKRLWKFQHDPLAAYKARVCSSVSMFPEPQLPHLNLVTDPMLDWGKAQERFASNQAVDKPAQEQQVMAPAYEPLRPTTQFHERFVEPFRDPFSTVPGGFGSMGPGR